MLKNFLFYSSPSLIQSVLSFLIVIPISTYYLEPQDFGILAILLLIVAPLIPLASSGGGSYTLNAYFFINDSKKNKKLVFNIALVDFLLMTFWCLIFYFLSSYLVSLFSFVGQQYIIHVKLLIISIWAGMFWPIISALLILKGNVKTHTFIEVNKYLINIGSTIYFLSFMKYGIISLILGPLIANLTFLFLEITLLFYNSIFEFKLKLIKKIIRLGFPTIPGNLSDLINQMSSRYFIQLFFNAYSMGIFFHSQSYANIIRNINKGFEKVFTREVLKLISIDKDLSQEKKNIEHLMKFYFSFIVIGGILSSAISYDVVNFITHGKFNDAARLIPLWYMTIYAYFYGYVYSQFLIVKKYTKILASTQLIIPLLGIGIVAFTTFKFGLPGAVIGTVSTLFLMYGIRQYYAIKNGFNVHINKYFWIGIFAHIFFYVLLFVFNVFLLKVIVIVFAILALIYLIYINRILFIIFNKT